jgi:MerR family transcriptional regulator, light-induced transcriptional regulator
MTVTSTVFYTLCLGYCLSVTTNDTEKQAPADLPTPQVPSADRSVADLSIGDLSRRTGVAAATLRMWEARHGFPIPKRVNGGHRRYDETDVALVQRVLHRRESGIRLDVAIREAAASTPPAAPSVFAALRSRHPGLMPTRLRKSTLLALSWAIEDENCARAQSAHVFGAFQLERFYRASERRWAELARVSSSAVVLAAFDAEPPLGGRPLLVHLPDDAPMRREWTVVCDAPDYPACLAAWELPGQSSVPDRRRQYEALWTVEPGPVRDAARTVAQVALDLGRQEMVPLLHELAASPPPAPEELRNANNLFNRVVTYVDRFGGSPPPVADLDSGPELA